MNQQHTKPTIAELAAVLLDPVWNFRRQFPPIENELGERVFMGLVRLMRPGAKLVKKPVPPSKYVAEGQLTVDQFGSIHSVGVTGKESVLNPVYPDATKPGGQYPTVSWYCQDKRVRASARVHVLVAEAWCRMKPKRKPCVRHRDDVPTNNWPLNLQWGTHADNQRDAAQNGRGVTKLNADAIKRIWREYDGRRGQVKALAKRHGVRPHAMTALLSGKTHSDLTGGRHPKHRKAGNREPCDLIRTKI